MLDERQIKAAELWAKGVHFIDIPKEVGVSRTTIYEWKKLEEFKAEHDRFVQEFNYAARGRISAAGPEAADVIINLMRHGVGRNKLLAALEILDRDLGKPTTKLEINDNRDNKDSVSPDVLDEEMDESEND